jgi:Fur family ferric uptake transcriptional regulator
MKQRRHTKQREVLESICMESKKPLTIDEILAMAHNLLPGLNRVTAYRNLNRLVEAGELTRVSHPVKGTLYERADRPHHHHFFCKLCESAFELPGCGLSENKMTPKGFVVESHEIFLHGICAACAS